MKRIRNAHCLLAGLAVLLLAVGNASAIDDTTSAKAKADASAKANAGAKAKADANANANANTKVKLDRPALKTVVERLFGTPDNGLFDGKGSFNLRAENMTMTSAEAANFFTSVNTQENFAAAVKAAEALHGEIWLSGTIDAQPFEMKLAGRQLKLDGLTLTASQRETLVAQLRAIEGLKEMQITAVVDGKRTMTKVQGSQEKLELLGPKKAGDKVGVDTSAKVDARERIEGPVRVDGAQRIESSGQVGLDRVLPGLGRR